VQSELQQLLTAIAADRVALIERHEAGARVVSHYDFNNTYQYVIAREETQLTWLQNALAEVGVAMPPAASALPVPSIGKTGKQVAPAAFKELCEDDERTLGHIESADDAGHRNNRIGLNLPAI